MVKTTTHWMVVRLALIPVVAMLLTPTTVSAHESRTHIMGTIRTADEGQMTVRTRDGKTVSVRLNESTVYQTVDGTTTDARPQAGSRVVIDVSGSGKDSMATQVRFDPGATKSEGNRAPVRR